MSDLTPERLDELERLLAEATPGPWQSMSNGNCALRDGSLVGQARLMGPERPYDARSYWHQSEEGLRTNVMTEADAELVAELRNTLPSLIEAARVGVLMAEVRQMWRYATYCVTRYEDGHHEVVVYVDDHDGLRAPFGQGATIVAALRDLLGKDGE